MFSTPIRKYAAFIAKGLNVDEEDGWTYYVVQDSDTFEYGITVANEEGYFEGRL